MNQLKAKIKRSLDWIYIEFNWWLFGPYEEVFDNDQVYFNSKNKIYNLIKNSYPNVIFAYKKVQDLNWNDIKFLHIIDIHNKKDIHLKFENLNYIYSDLINKTIIINIDNKKITINQRTLDIINEEIEEIIEIKKYIIYIKDKNLTPNQELDIDFGYVKYKINNEFYNITNKNYNYIISKVWIIKVIKNKDVIYKYFLEKYLSIFLLLACLIFYFLFINIFITIIVLIFIFIFLLLKFKITSNDIIKIFFEDEKKLKNELNYIKSNYKKTFYTNINKQFNFLNKLKKHYEKNLNKEQKIIIIFFILFLLINIYIFILFLSRLFKI